MDKNARIPTKTSRGRGWRNQKRPDQQFYVPGALHRKKQEQNTDNTEENIRERSRGTTEALQETRKQNDEDCIKNVGKLSETSSNSSNCIQIDENSENKKENMADHSLSSELASGHSDSKSFELNRNSVEILPCAAQCDDQEQSAENKGERLADQTIQIPTLVTQREFKSTEINVCNTNKLEKNTECSSKTDANCPAQTLSCEVSNTQGLVLSKSICTQSENTSEHRKTVDISAITTRENTGLDNRAGRTTINDLKESSVILSLHNNKTSNESLEKLKDNVKNQHEKDLVTSKETCEKCISIEDTMLVDKDSENIKEYDEVQADNLHSSSLRKEEIQQGGCVSICEPVSNDITKKGIFNSERTEIQSEQTSNDNTDKSTKDIDDTEPKRVQTKENVREDKQQCNFEKTSNSQSLADGDLKNENGLEQRTHLCSEEKTEIVNTNEMDNTSCSEILEALEETVDDHNQNNDVSTERKAKITYIEDEIRENCTEKSDSMVSENKEEQPSKLEKVKKKKKSKKSDHLESKEVKKKKKNKKEHCESSKDEESGLNGKKAKCISKTQVKGKQEGIKEEALDQDGKQTGEDDSVDDDDDDSDSWLNKFNDDGECLDPELIKMLSKATGIKKPVKHKTQFDFYSLAEKDMELDDGYGHIVEIYDFSADLKTQDLTKALSAFKDQGYELKWVDDTHALAAFASPLADYYKVIQLNKNLPMSMNSEYTVFINSSPPIRLDATKDRRLKQALDNKLVKYANQAIQMCSSPLLKLRPVSQGIADSKKKAKRCFEFLQPYKPRPQTTKLTAHMLVTGALGVKSRMTKEEKQKEKDKLKEAREQKRQEKQRKADIWGD